MSSSNKQFKGKNIELIMQISAVVQPQLKKTRSETQQVLMGRLAGKWGRVSFPVY